MESKKVIGIVGFGNMGKAIFSLLEKRSNLNFIIYSRHKKAVRGALFFDSLEKLLEKSDVVFLCLKPQDFYQLKLKLTATNATVISIMAGTKIDNIEKIMKVSKIIRTMPNLPIKIGKGVIGWHAKKKNFSQTELMEVQLILNDFGDTFYLKDEGMLDALTAISGSGPAYVFLFINALVLSAQKLGFSHKVAQEIVLATFSGSLDYLKREKKINIENMITHVTSKKGTTEAALKEIDIHNFYNIWQRGTRKARDRAKKISAYEIK